MKYEKPSVMDLSVRSADGANHVDVCFPGATANNNTYCGNGTSGTTACQTGTAPGNMEVCVGGGSPASGSGGSCVGGITAGPDNDCYSGGSAYTCNKGSSPFTLDFGCTVGPSYVGT